MNRSSLCCLVLVPLACSALGCASIGKSTGAALAAAAATLAVHATAAVIQEAAKGPRRRTVEGEEIRAETPCERRLREWKELRVNPREEPPERLACRPNGAFGTTGGVVDAHPGSDGDAAPRPAATAYYPSF